MSLRKTNPLARFSASNSFFAIIALVAISSICITGCEKSTGTSGTSKSDGATSSGRQFVTIGTAPGGGTFALVGNAVANTLQANKGDLNWSVSAKGTKGTQENIRKLESKEIEFGMANAGISYFATRGEGNWKTKRDIRVVATLAPNVGIFVTLESTGIKTIADLKGKRVVLGPAGAGFDYFLKPLLAAHDLSYEDMTVISGNYLTAGEMMSDGKADAAFMGGAIPISAVTSLCSTQDVVFIKLDDNVTEKLKDYPFYFPVPVKADAYSDLNEDMVGLNVGNMHLITHASVSEDIVYNFTKLMYESREKIAQQHPAGKAINPKNVARDTGTPFHPGAIKYYKEAGIIPAE